MERRRLLSNPGVAAEVADDPTIADQYEATLGRESDPLGENLLALGIRTEMRQR
jgi:hypothetical protein